MRLSGGSAHRFYTVVVFIVLASLDNVTIGLVPPLYSPIAAAMGVSESAISLATAVTYLVTAVAAVGWAYVGDRADRKPLLMAGTLIWAAGAAATATTNSYGTFFASQVLAAVGLGAVASVGFSVVSDLITPKRRGLVMSFWGLSQGVGTLAGTLIGGLLGSGNWRMPFVVLAVLGVVATVAYLFTYNIKRGQGEPQLAAIFAAGEEYSYRINHRDLPVIARRRSNVWLTLQGLTAQMVFGSLVFLPRLFQAKAEQLGYNQDTAIKIGSVYATLFTLGGVLAIVGGIIGDRLQRRTLRGRAMVASIGILAAIPFYVVLFFVPVRLSVPNGASTGSVISGVLASVVTEPTMAVSLLAALLALALTSANSPNWYALIAEVNPPEHRGTVFSLGNLVNGVGRAVGNSSAGAAFRALDRVLAPPLNFAVGLAIFQVFFIPTGIMYWLASRHTPTDITEVRELLAERAAETTHHEVPSTPAS